MTAPENISEPPDILLQVIDLVDKYERGELQNITPDRIAAAVQGQRLLSRMLSATALTEMTTV